MHNFNMNQSYDKSLAESLGLAPVSKYNNIKQEFLEYENKAIENFNNDNIGSKH